MKDKLDIQTATKDHAEDIATIVSSSADWYESIVDEEDMDEHDVDESWALDNMEKREFFVAKVDKDVVGTVSLQEVDEDSLYLGYVYLHTDHVGNGFGGKLLEFAKEELKRRDMSSMYLIVHPEAEWAVRAYEKFGFKLVHSDREDVLSWKGGWLSQYYEEGFILYEFKIND